MKNEKDIWQAVEAEAQRIASEVICNIRIYAGAENVRTAEEFYLFMKRRGGYSEFIRTGLGPAPPHAENRWWIWNTLGANGMIREKVQIALSGDFAEAK